MDKNRPEELAQLQDEFAQHLRQQREALLQEVAEGEADLKKSEGSP
jgi:hypothetical protein